ncbi:uncharacterized protein VDAG_08986 [Verticillium dahliae VdLs.17]|uniref:Uncharacterized protein n=2 Tax=Verticillium dahliae TaxID=27337 RepID=G2XG07_VERDV|nr:uncharacterized protein VDAG_08986 [Verticillium dahliae VdLs.17]EGY18826.1 hypothetical protein VDAG_08986 [Verticillium dahliae VdLs.17]
MDVTVVTLVTVNALTDTGQVVVCGMGVVVGVVVGVTVVVLGLRHAQALDILAALPSHPDASARNVISQPGGPRLEADSEFPGCKWEPGGVVVPFWAGQVMKQATGCSRAPSWEAYGGRSV